MIQYNPKSWFSLIFAAYSRHVFRRLFPLLLAMGLLSSGVCYVELHYLEEPVELSNVVPRCRKKAAFASPQPGLSAPHGQGGRHHRSQSF